MRGVALKGEDPQTDVGYQAECEWAYNRRQRLHHFKIRRLEAENDIEEAIGFMDDEDLQANDFWHQNPGKKRDTVSATQ